MTDDATTSTSTPPAPSPIVMGGEQPVVDSPIVESNPPAPDSAPVAPEPSPPPVEDVNKTKTTPEWAQKRINELTAKRYEAERAAKTESDARLAAEAKTADLLKQLSEAKGGTPAPTTNGAKPPAQLSEEEINRLVMEKAALIAQVNDFNKACNTIAETGKKEFADWDDTLKNLGLVGAVGQNASPEFLETAIELQAPHKVLHYLGSNLEEAEKVIKLPPKKMALELARLEARLNAPASAPVTPPVSSAPPPVIPVAGGAKPPALSIDDPNISAEDFFAIRAKQIEERRKRYLRH